MSRFSAHGTALAEALRTLALHVRAVRGLTLVDRGGLPLASTLHANALEESLAALASTLWGQLERAQADLVLGPLRFAHVSARDRQVIWVPVDGEASLIAIVETGANATDVSLHLLALAKDLLADPARDSKPTD